MSRRFYDRLLVALWTLGSTTVFGAHKTHRISHKRGTCEIRVFAVSISFFRQGLWTSLLVLLPERVLLAQSRLSETKIILSQFPLLRKGYLSLTLRAAQEYNCNKKWRKHGHKDSARRRRLTTSRHVPP